MTNLSDLLRAIKPVSAAPSCEVEYTDDEAALLRAVQEWRQIHGKRFVSAVEIARIVKALAAAK